MLRIIFFSAFIISSQLQGQSLSEIWRAIDSIEVKCNQLQDFSNAIEMVQSYEKSIISLNGMLDKIPAKNRNAFVEKLIKLRILKMSTNIELIKNLNSKEMNNSTFKNLNGLINLVRSTFYSVEKARQEFTSSAPKEPVLALFGMSSASEELFRAQIWNKYCCNLEDFILEKETKYYDIFTPDKTRLQLWYFIQKSVYPENKVYNQKAIDAYNLLFLSFTNDGERSSITAFTNYVKGKTNNTYLWDKLELHPSFIHLKDSLSTQFRDWENVLLDSTAKDKELISLINKSAPREVAFVALQKLIKPMIAVGDFESAAIIVKKYVPLFQSKEPWAETASKVEVLLELLLSTKKYWELAPIRGIDSSDNEISYFLNIDNSSIVVNPDTRTKTKQYNINKINSSFAKENIKFETYTTPDFLWFEKRADRKNVVIYEPQTRYHIKGPNYISSDFFLSEDGKILFFISTDTAGRYQPNQEGLEYSSPGLINKTNRFQEKERGKPFHGKISGNPNTDIYYCVKLESGWTTPSLLHGVNSPFCERSPVYDQKNAYLYFASEGFPGLGGFDIFRANVSLHGTEIRLDDPQIENVVEVNSPFDELFYNQNISPAIVSSNRNGKDFDLFRIKGPIVIKRKYIPKILPNDKNFTKEDNFREGDQGEDLQPIFSFDWECVDDPNAKDDKDDEITVLGKIYYSDKTAVKSAKIVFMDIDGNNYACKTSDNDNRYVRSLPFRVEKYKVRVTVYYENGSKIESETESFIKVCDNSEKRKRIKQDYLVPKKNQKGYFSTCPFFFNTNIHNVTLTNKKQARIYYKQDADHYTYQCIGYADIRGDSAHNHQLALRRAEYVGKFLQEEADINNEDITVISKGATKYFSDQKIENYKSILDFSVKGIFSTRREIELLLNRRVEVRKIKKYLTEEH